MVLVADKTLQNKVSEFSHTNMKHREKKVMNKKWKEYHYTVDNFRQTSILVIVIPEEEGRGQKKS